MEPIANTTRLGTLSEEIRSAGQRALKAGEIAARLGVTSQHILNLLDDGSLIGIELKSRGAKVRCPRFPIESYRDFILARLEGDYRGQLLRSLPEPVRRQLHRDIGESLSMV